MKIENEELYLEVKANTTVLAVFQELPKHKLTVLVKGNGTCTLSNSTWIPQS